MINHTGHWDEHCSDGAQLTFVFTHMNGTQEIDVLADSFGTYVNEDLLEADMLTIQILNEEGNLILSRIKVYNPSNPEDNGPAIASGPYIRICQINELEISGF